MGRRESKKEATKKKILEVSLQLFQKMGFGRTTMRDIAKKCGIALGTTYNYFPTKEHIALYFFEQALDERIFLLLSIELEKIAPYEEFLNLIVTHAVMPTSRLHPFSIDSQRLKMKYLDFVGGILESAKEKGEFSTLGFDSMILSAFWVFHMGILMFWMNDQSRKKEDTFILMDKSLRFILNAMKGKAPLGPKRRK